MPSAPVPLIDARHAWQVPPHAESQQTPSTQKPLAHSIDEAHAEPSGSSDAQVPLVAQYCVVGVAHCATVVQVVAQIVDDAHAYAPHELVVGAQTPRPLHAFVVSEAFAHVATPQTARGSRPPTTFVHVPSLPATPESEAAHAVHAPPEHAPLAQPTPPHALSQQ